MNVISRYLVHELLKLFGLCMAAFICIYVLVDFFEIVDNFIEAKVSLWRLGEFLILKLPLMIQQLTPAAILMGTILSLSAMARNREIVVFRGNGISLYRLFVPYLLVSLCLSFGMFFLNENVLPAASRRMNHIWNIEVQKRPLNTFFRNERFWYRGRDVIYHVTLYDQATQALKGVTLYRFGQPFGLTQRIDAREARWDGNDWVFYEGLKQNLERDGAMHSEKFAQLRLNLHEKPDDFRHIIRNPEELSFTELKSYIQKIESDGYDASKYVVDLDAKVALPFVCVIMTLTGFALALRQRGGAAVAAGVGMSIGLAFTYWVLLSLALSLGHSGLLPPMFAAWLANLIFFFGGLTMFSYLPQ